MHSMELTQGKWYRQQESNLHLSLRRTPYYPLYDGDTRDALYQPPP